MLNQVSDNCLFCGANEFHMKYLAQCAFYMEEHKEYNNIKGVYACNKEAVGYKYYMYFTIAYWYVF